MRITADEIVSLYAKHGMRPIRGRIVSKDNRCCGLGVLCIEKGIAIDPLSTYEVLYKIYGQDYVQGFYIGFDGHPERYLKDITDLREMEGYNDGGAANRAVTW